MKRLAIFIQLLFPLCAVAQNLTNGNYIVVLQDGVDPQTFARGQGVNPHHIYKTVPGFSGFFTSNRLQSIVANRQSRWVEPDVLVLTNCSQTVPTGVQRIGTLSNVVAQIGTGFAASYGGTGSDGLAAVTTDGSGNIYAAGWFSGTATFGPTNVTSAGGLNLFILKVSAAKVFQWVKAYGATGDETPTSIALDGSGNILVGGYFTGTGNFGGTNCVAVGGQDIWLAKYTSAGAFAWEQAYGSTDVDALYGLAVDSGNNVVFTGSFRQTINFGGTNLPSILGGDTGYLVKLNSSGVHQWSERFTGVSANYGRAIGLNATNSIFVTGEFFNSINCGLTNQLSAGSSANIYVAKFDTTAGACIWQIVHGALNTTKSRALTVNTNGDVAISGFCGPQNTATDLGGGPIQCTGLFNDGFAASYSGLNGVFQWQRGILGTQTLTPVSMAHDSQNNLIIAGFWQGTGNFGPRSLVGTGSSFNIFIEAFTPAGSPYSVDQMGGNGTDQPYTVTVDALNRYLVGGVFQGTGLFHGDSLTSAGSYDAWLCRYKDVNKVTLAIIDTGIQLNHPDLNVVGGVSFVTNNVTGNDDNGHGTHVAGIAGALDNGIGVVGVAPGVQEIAVKVLDSTGTGPLSTIIAGVDYVTQHSNIVQIANMSLGGQGASDSLRLAIQNSVAAGVVYVVAAGNSGLDVYGADKIQGTADDFFPAAYPEVATVSAEVDTDGLAGGLGISSTYGADDTLATFSNWSGEVVASNPVFSPGLAIDVAAPGYAILSTYTNSSYTTLSGTSMASPHVAGAAAVYVASNGRATNAAGVYAIRQAIINLAEPQSSWGINKPSALFANDTGPEGLLSMLNIGQTFTPIGSPPTVFISSPTNGLVTATNVSIPFAAGASGGLSSSLIWSSSIQGQIGTGASFSRTLTNGLHTITARVTDSNGNLGFSNVVVAVGNPGATAPTLNILTPLAGQSFPTGATVSFTGTATDAQDGNITGKIQWTLTNNASLLGAGSPLNVTFGNGTFTVQATVTDSNFLTSTSSVSFVVGGSTNLPARPVITITNPTNNASLTPPTNGLFVFSCIVTDAVDGVITPKANWYLTFNGSPCGANGAGCLMGTGSPITNGFTQGFYTFFVCATNSSNLAQTNQVSFFINAGVTNTPPQITILTPANGQTFTFGTPINFQASAIDLESGNLGCAVIWTDKFTNTTAFPGTCLNQQLYNYATNSTLAVGTHTITATVTDTGVGPGTTNLSSSASINVVIQPPVSTTLTVTGSSQFPSYNRKAKASLSANVSSGGQPVAGAVVQFKIAYNNASGKPSPQYFNVTTDGFGNAPLVWTVANSVNPLPQTAVVTLTATKAGLNSGISSFSFIISQ